MSLSSIPRSKFRVDLRHHPVPRPARVVGRGLEEVEECHGVRGVRRPRRHDHRRGVRARPIARRMADRAGLGDAREAHGLLREADRQLPALLPGDPERRDSRPGRQQVAEHPRQHVEDRIGDPEVPLGPERAVLEPLLLRAGAELGPPRRLDVARSIPAAPRGRNCTRRRPRRPRRGSTSTATTRATLYQGPGSASPLGHRASPSEGLQMLDQRPLLLRRAAPCP